MSPPLFRVKKGGGECTHRNILLFNTRTLDGTKYLCMRFGGKMEAMLWSADRVKGLVCKLTVVETRLY